MRAKPEGRGLLVVHDDLLPGEIALHPQLREIVELRRLQSRAEQSGASALTRPDPTSSGPWGRPHSRIRCTARLPAAARAVQPSEATRGPEPGPLAGAAARGRPAGRRSRRRGVRRRTCVACIASIVASSSACTLRLCVATSSLSSRKVVWSKTREITAAATGRRVPRVALGERSIHRRAAPRADRRGRLRSSKEGRKLKGPRALRAVRRRRQRATRPNLVRRARGSATA